MVDHILRTMTWRNVLAVAILVYLLMGFTFLAHGQEIQHAPTAEQCSADIAVWKAQSKVDIIALPVGTLLLRSHELHECRTVFTSLAGGHASDDSEWATTLRDVYSQHITDRALKFINRHQLRAQFDNEDAQGAR